MICLEGSDYIRPLGAAHQESYTEACYNAKQLKNEWTHEQTKAGACVCNLSCTDHL